MGSDPHVDWKPLKLKVKEENLYYTKSTDKDDITPVFQKNIFEVFLQSPHKAILLI